MEGPSEMSGKSFSKYFSSKKTVYMQRISILTILASNTAIMILLSPNTNIRIVCPMIISI
jgi:hypothetical protein